MSTNKSKTKAQKFFSISKREVSNELFSAAKIILSALRSGKKPKKLGPFLDSWFRTRMHNLDPTQNVDNYGLEYALTLLAKDDELDKIKSFYKRSVDAWVRYKTNRKNLEESLIKNFLFVSESFIMEDLDVRNILKAKSPEEQYEILKKVISNGDRIVGHGTSRIVVNMPDGNHVLKAATSKRGIEQNRMEKQISSIPKALGGVAMVVDSSPDYRWIVSEKATPLMSKDEFIELIGISPFTLSKAIQNNQIKYIEHSLTKRGITLVQALSAIIANHDIYEPDLYKIDSWGIINRNGSKQLVLIDYGLTHELVHNFYPELTKS